jgi:transporter family-2 protein
MSYQPLLALFAGAAIALQAGLNASLGRQLGNPLFATVVAFGAGLGFTLLATLAVTGRLPEAVVVRAVPVYLWFTGGLFSAFAIVSVYWLIPRIGIGATHKNSRGRNAVGRRRAGQQRLRCSPTT